MTTNSQSPPTEPSRDAQIEILLEDFKARWQELLNFESEVSRWFTLYVTAVIAVIGWAMGNIPASGIQILLKQHDGLNTIFVLSLALLNPVYILALAFNGYRIQQIGQYLYSHVSVRISILASEPFNVWEDWRRTLLTRPGTYGPEWIRRVYYISIAIVPAFVSGLLLLVYAWFEGSTQARWSGHNCFAYVVVIVNVASAGLSIWTSAQNKQWNSLITLRIKEEERHDVRRRTFFPDPPVDEPLKLPAARPSGPQTSRIASAAQTVHGSAPASSPPGGASVPPGGTDAPSPPPERQPRSGRRKHRNGTPGH